MEVHTQQPQQQGSHGMERIGVGWVVVSVTKGKGAWMGRTEFG